MNCYILKYKDEFLKRSNSKTTLTTKHLESAHKFNTKLGAINYQSQNEKSVAKVQGNTVTVGEFKIESINWYSHPNRKR